MENSNRSIVALDVATIGDDVDLSSLNRFGVVTIHQTTSPNETSDRIHDAKIVVVNKVQIRNADIARAQALELICLTATGANNIDIDAARSRGIGVANVAGYSTDSVAQHTFAMLLYLLEHMRTFDDYVRGGSYIRSKTFTHFEPAYWELSGKRFGIIGLGRIGRAVAKIASAFGADVVYFSSTGKNTEQPYARLALDDLLRTSDVVSVHSPLTESTRGLIGTRELGIMKPTAILLNLGRGGIVDEAAAVAAIDADRLYGFATDVLETEPMSEESPLLSVKNRDRVLVTPHMAWGTVESRRRVIHEVVLNMEAYVRGERRNRID